MQNKVTSLFLYNYFDLLHELPSYSVDDLHSLFQVDLFQPSILKLI